MIKDQYKTQLNGVNQSSGPKVIPFLFILMVVYSCISPTQINNRYIEIDSTPANPSASLSAQAILRYIAALSSPTNKKAIIGQNCFHGDEISGNDPLDKFSSGYFRLITQIYRETGKWIAIAAMDYEYMKICTPEELSKANKVLIEHWNQGGLVSINLSPLNPWIIQEGSNIRRPPKWDGKGSPTDKSKAKMDNLLIPSSEVYRCWMKKLDRIASALKELQDAGVVVLWRPMQEMNGNWFWWGNNSQGYKAVYRHMFKYFTENKKLNNLLWVYSPFGAINNFNSYPGGDYVDIVAPTYYNDGLTAYNYTQLALLEKPLAAGEYGPDFNTYGKKGGWDTTKYIEKIRTNYPRFAYWTVWHSYEDYYMSFITGNHYNELLNDPDVITLDKLNWKMYDNKEYLPDTP